MESKLKVDRRTILTGVAALGTLPSYPMQRVPHLIVGIRFLQFQVK